MGKGCVWCSSVSVVAAGRLSSPRPHSGRQLLALGGAYVPALHKGQRGHGAPPALYRSGFNVPDTADGAVSGRT